MICNNWLNRCHFGDVRDVLRRMIADGVKVNTIVTSPPYWGLRSYLPGEHADKAHEIGSEPTLREFLATMTEVMMLAREVLADDGTMWMNMGDSYATAATASSLKPKDLVGQPWRLAFALQDAGWWLRQDIIWSKPNPMPESTRDRCTKAHEYIFLMSKSERYYYDFDRVQEPVNGGAHARRSAEALGLKRPGFGYGYDEAAKPRYKTPDGWDTRTGQGGHGSLHREGREKGEVPPEGVGRRQGPPGNPAERKLAAAGGGTKNNVSMDEAMSEMRSTRNRRSVWTVPSEPFKGAHFATFPSKLIEHCILAGAPAGGVVLDIFMGSGTTAHVAEKLGRQWIGIDIDTRNKALQDERLRQPSLSLESAA